MVRALVRNQICQAPANAATIWSLISGRYLCPSSKSAIHSSRIACSMKRERANGYYLSVDCLLTACGHLSLASSSRNCATDSSQRRLADSSSVRKSRAPRRHSFRHVPNGNLPERFLPKPTAAPPPGAPVWLSRLG
jgi:hypothetical protein